MQIVGDNFRFDLQNLLQVCNRFFEEVVALQVFQITDVLAEEGVLTFGEADCVLEFASHRKNGRDFLVQENGNGNEAATAAEVLGCAALQLCGCGQNPYYGIIAAQQNFAIVHQEEVRKT